MRESTPPHEISCSRLRRLCGIQEDMLKLVPLVLLAACGLHAQPEGLWQGYDGEWRHVSSQLVALADAIAAEKYSWRPAPGVRTVSEVFMHIALAN